MLLTNKYYRTVACDLAVYRKMNMKIKILTLIGAKISNSFRLKTGMPNSPTPILKNYVEQWRCKFQESNIPEAEENLKLIACYVLNIEMLNELEKYQNISLTDEQINDFNKCCECKLARIPIQYILKEWQFREIKLKMLPPVFIPRPETEMLIDIVTQALPNKPNFAVEIGCGSGAICIALLKIFTELDITAIDRSKMACILTMLNAKNNEVNERLRVINKPLSHDSEFEEIITNELDFIVSNPPYVLSSEIKDLDPEVKLYEDIRALDGGTDGLDVIKNIIQFSSRTLRAHKSCFLEIHHNHVPIISKWLNENNSLKMVLQKSYKDFLGYDRFIHIIKVE